eukprot:TRINITY_DN12302_c3_g1_i1.p1 TRINITY_DN12302_c3_g1~~TRINITY_DN12302_c3_g1_i1.p1  ORF type:complete len:623 (+),score=158.24 TRINITY_DN12302_c3_g1_i1:20-1888(+)
MSERFESVCKAYTELFQAESPVERPYDKKYEARKIIEAYIVELDNEKSSLGDESTQEIDALRGHCHMLLGINFYETEENSDGEKTLSKALGIFLNDEVMLKHFADEMGDISGVPFNDNVYENPVDVTTILNQLGVIWSERGESQRALNYLLFAEILYNKLSQVTESTLEDDYEEVYTLTLYYLTQVFAQKPETVEKSLQYCQWTLERQAYQGEVDPIAWSVNSFNLTKYFIAHRKFMEVVLWLTASQQMLNAHSDELKEMEEGIDGVHITEKLRETRGHISNMNGKFYASLLEQASNKAMNASYNDDEERIGLADKEITAQVFTELVSPRFMDFSRFVQALNLDIGHLAEVYAELPTADQIICEREVAAMLLRRGLGHFMKALDSFALDEACSKHCKIQQHISSLYKLYLFYEPEENFNRRISVQKKRLTHLQNLVDELNPAHFLKLTQQLLYELGLIHFELVCLGLGKCRETGKALKSKDIKHLELSHKAAVRYFTSFMQSFIPLEEKDKNGSIDVTAKEELPEYVPLQDIDAYLTAQLYVARTYNQAYGAWPHVKQMQCLTTCLKAHERYISLGKSAIERCKKESRGLDIKGELEIAQELVQLLPSRIAQLHAEYLQRAG